jgi:hypothetical protein
MDEKPETKEDHPGSEDYLRQTEGDFNVSPRSGLYEPEARNKEQKVAATVQVIESPVAAPKRPQGSWQDIIANFISAVAVSLAFLTLCGLVVGAFIAKGQWDEMRKATEASTDAANTAACALKENERQFQQTLEQMRAQSQAMHESAGSEIATNRAWIVPDFPPQHKRTIQEANLDWHNAGKTPAISVFSWKEYFTGGFPHQMRTCAMVASVVKKQPTDLRQYQPFVSEGGRYTIGLDRAPSSFGQQPISIHGCIWYTDISSNTEKSSEFFYLAFQNENARPSSEGISVFFARPFVYK